MKIKSALFASAFALLAAPALAAPAIPFDTDKDGEGTLDARELRGPAGRELMKLLRDRKSVV